MTVPEGPGSSSGGADGPRPSGGGRRTLVIVLVVLLVAVAGTGAWLLWPVKVGGTAEPAGTGGRGDERGGGRDVLDIEGPLTDDDLAGVDTEKLLTESFVAFLTQPVLHTRMEWIRDVPSYLGDTDYPHSVVHGGYDFRTNDYAYHEEDGFETLCVGGTEYSLNYEGVWEEAGGCAITSGGYFGNAESSLDLTGTVSDGILTAGLTEQEARAFLGKLWEDYPNYIDIGQPSVAEHEGQRYVRLPFTLHQNSVEGHRYGMHTLTGAFRVLGDKFKTHPLLPATAGTMSSQVEAVYYLDPKTLLPAYTESLMYIPDDDPKATQGDVVRVEHFWDGAVPTFEPTAATPPAPEGLSWPGEKFEPGALPTR